MYCIGVTWGFEEEGNTAFVQVNTIDIILKMKFRFTATATLTQHDQNLSCDNEFHLHENKKSFHNGGFVQRLGATWKWPIVRAA